MTLLASTHLLSGFAQDTPPPICPPDVAGADCSLWLSGCSLTNVGDWFSDFRRDCQTTCQRLENTTPCDPPPEPQCTCTRGPAAGPGDSSSEPRCETAGEEHCIRCYNAYVLNGKTCERPQGCTGECQNYNRDQLLCDRCYRKEYFFMGKRFPAACLDAEDDGNGQSNCNDDHYDCTHCTAPTQSPTQSPTFLGPPAKLTLQKNTIIAFNGKLDTSARV